MQYCTCWTVAFPPLRRAIPSFSVGAITEPMTPDGMWNVLQSEVVQLWLTRIIFTGYRVNNITKKNKATDKSLHKLYLCSYTFPTSAGTDGLQDHLRSSTMMQPGLLVQQLLFLHFLLLRHKGRIRIYLITFLQKRVDTLFPPRANLNVKCQVQLKPVGEKHFEHSVRIRAHLLTSKLSTCCSLSSSSSLWQLYRPKCKIQSIVTKTRV